MVDTNKEQILNETTEELSEDTIRVEDTVHADGSEGSKTQEGAKKPRKAFNKKVAGYVLVGVLCASLSGVVSTLGTIYVYTNSNGIKNSALYNDLLQKQITAINSDAQAKYKASPTTATGSSLTAAEIANEVSPAVVGVSTTTNADIALGQGATEGMGSGIIINEEGYILTNYHVISGASTVKVIFNTGKEVTAKIVNFDQTSDIAVIKVTESVTMPGVAKLGDSSTIQAGELAVAIGNPLGKEFLGSVTVGVISAVNRVIDEASKIKYIQTDAAINEGNSGGPLLNGNGEVIGINTAKITATGVEGLGFAIPINQVKDKLQGLLKPMLRLGITALDITPDLAKQYNLTSGSYVYVRDVNINSAAEKAGLKVGDMITKFDGQKVTTVEEINSIKAKHKAGDAVKITITRDNKTMELTVTLTEGN